MFPGIIGEDVHRYAMRALDFFAFLKPITHIFFCFSQILALALVLTLIA